MFQCIIQPKNGWNTGYSRQEMKEVFPDLRLQLQEQLRSLDSRVETQVALTSELQDFFRKRAEVELECSRSLDKLAKSLSFRQKELKQKRDQWHLFSVSNCWQQLISETKKQSQEHALLAEIYNTHLTTRLFNVADDLTRIYKRCKEVGIEAHEELLKVLHELHTSTKTYHAYQTECKQTEAKLKVVEAQKAKLELAIPKEKIERSKKIRLVDKEIQKRRNKYTDARFKALKAKNEYILCMDAANAAVQKYFVDDLSDLIDCMDLGFYQCVARALNMYLSTQEQMKKSLQSNMDTLMKFVCSLDSRLDKQKFLEANNSAFIMPKKFEFQAPILKGEEVVDTSETGELESTGFIRQELEQRLLQLHKRLEALRTESDELWKTLETAESSLLEMLTAKDYDAMQFFIDVSKPIVKQPETITLKLRADRHETDQFHLSKFRDYMLGTNRIARLQAKYDHIRKVLGETDQGGSSPALAQTIAGGPQPPRKVRRKRIGQLQSSGNPRLFGGSLEEYLEMSNEDIPIVLKSCIRVINLYGLHHHGIFRVSGSQSEINNFKDSFERGDDPLADVNDASDINSVAGVLKLYLRELREPLFPIVYFEQFMELAQMESKHGFVAKMHALVKSLPRSVFIVLRYLFAFLNHISEYSDENMMDPYNLAICFGPTLVPVPEDKDQVQYQNLVNELIKNVITYNEDIFPNDGGVVYEKYITKEPDEGEVGDAPGMDQSQDELDSEIGCPSEDESEFLEAVAQFDFIARSHREVGFKKGDTVTLYSQVSGDWWKGSVNGMDGLIPDKYIMLKIRDEDRERLDSTSSLKEEHVTHHHRSRTASDSFLSTQPKSSLTLSPSLHSEKKLLYVKAPSPLYLAASGESLASTSPESPSEFGSMEKDPMTVTLTTTMPIPTGVVLSGGGGKGHANNSPSGTGVTLTTSSCSSSCSSSAPPPSSRVYSSHCHQRSLSVSDDRVFISQPVWREALMEAEEVETGVCGATPPSKGTTATTLLSEETVPLPIREETKSVISTTTIESSSSARETDIGPEIDCTATTMNLSFSTPKTVENEDVPERIPSPDRKIHTKTKSWDGPSQTHHHPLNSSTTTNKPVGIISHSKSKSEDLEPTNVKNKALRSNIQFWEMRSRHGHTPDLVMDLPVQSSDKAETSPSSSGSGSPAAPDSPDMNTAAECFAKQNQCTLKKNERSCRSSPQRDGANEGGGAVMVVTTSSDTNNVGPAKAQISFFEANAKEKPQVKVKPQVLCKPRFPSQFKEDEENSKKEGQ